MPAVSVIMAAYNVEPYLTAAMQSVMRQTFRDLELIVIDDGSTGSVAYRLALANAGDDPRVRVLQRSMAASRRRAISGCASQPAA